MTGSYRVAVCIVVYLLLRRRGRRPCWPRAENLIEMTHRAVRRVEDPAIREHIGGRAAGTEPSGSFLLGLRSHGIIRIESCGVLFKILQEMQAIGFDMLTLS